MKRFADALAWHMQAIASDHVMQGRFTGLTVAVTHKRRGEEHLLRIAYSLEGEQVVANLWPEFESLPSRQLAEVY